jgi:hypothetical protein
MEKGDIQLFRGDVEWPLFLARSFGPWRGSGDLCSAREEKTRTATPAATHGVDDVGNPNPFKMRALRPPGNVGARRILRREAACFRPGIASRPGGRKAAVHVVQ